MASDVFKFFDELTLCDKSDWSGSLSYRIWTIYPMFFKESFGRLESYNLKLEFFEDFWLSSKLCLHSEFWETRENGVLYEVRPSDFSSGTMERRDFSFKVSLSLTLVAAFALIDARSSLMDFLFLTLFSLGISPSISRSYSSPSKSPNISCSSSEIFLAFDFKFLENSIFPGC